MPIELIVGLVSLAGTVLTAVITLVVAERVHNVHLTLNSRLDQWKKESAEAAVASALAAYKEGVQAGKGPTNVN